MGKKLRVVMHFFSNRLFLTCFLTIALSLSCLGQERTLTDFTSQDGSFKLVGSVSFEEKENPHAVMSLFSRELAYFVVVVKQPRIGSVENLLKGPLKHDTYTFLSKKKAAVDGEPAAVFLAEDVFGLPDLPPFRTLMVMVNRGDHSYTLQFHFLKSASDQGVQLGENMLQTVKWL
jgi:hypothetical protein